MLIDIPSFVLGMMTLPAVLLTASVVFCIWLLCQPMEFDKYSRSIEDDF